VNRPKQLTTHKTDWIAKEPGTRFGAAAFAAKMAPEFSILSMGCGGQLAQKQLNLVSKVGPSPYFLTWSIDPQ
jgi:hypothetical protein